MTERRRPLPLGPAQFAIVAVTLLVVLPVVISVVLWGGFSLHVVFDLE